MKIKLKYAAISDIGNVRSNNEDNVYFPGESSREPRKNIYTFSGERTESKAFVCVCDGMGGHSAGEVASYMAVSQVSNNYGKIIENVKSAAGVKKVMSEFISGVNDAIYHASDTKPELRSMGTTLTGVYFINGGAFFVNIGDSRVYMVKGSKMTQLTIDHADSDNKHALTRFLGMSSEYGNVYPDVDIKKRSIGMKSRFLLCSDGLTDMVDDTLIRNILLENKQPSEAAEELVKQAKKNGGRDNITVLVIDAEPTNKPAMLMRNKAVLGCLIVALLAGSAVTYYQLNKPEPTGISFTNLSSDIQNAKDWSEAEEVMEKQINGDNGLEAKYKELYDFAYSVDESDQAVSDKNIEMKGLVEELRKAKEAMTGQFNVLRTNTALSDEEKVQRVKEMMEDKTTFELIDKCEAKKAEVQQAIQEWQSRVEAEKKKREEEEAAKRRKEEEYKKPDNGGGGSVNKTPSDNTNRTEYTKPQQEVPKQPRQDPPQDPPQSGTKDADW